MRKDEARTLVLEILTTAPGPMTSRQVYNADARLSDYKQVVNVLTDLRGDGLVTRRNGGYVLGGGTPLDAEYGEVSRVHPALALLGRQDLGEYGIEDLDVKLGVLRRLEQLLEPSIGKTLRLIREDLARLAVTEEG